VVDEEIPLPDWSEFEEADLRDLDDELRERFRALAISSPKGVAYDKQVLTDDRRYDVPTTIIACEFSSDQLREWIGRGTPYVAELAAMRESSTSTFPPATGPSSPSPSSWGRRSCRQSTGVRCRDRDLARG
jgi:hypothetical protein